MGRKIRGAGSATHRRVAGGPRSLWAVRALGVLALALSPGVPAGAQVVASTGRASAPQAVREQACAGPLVGSLGITGWDCRGDCTLTLDKQGREQAWSFSAEPRVNGVVPGGPADGLLRAGDLIVAIDGALITTPAGGARIANLAPGTAVVVRYRRDGRLGEATVRTTAVCSTSWQPPEPPEPPRLDAPPARVTAPRLRPGVNIRTDSALPRGVELGTVARHPRLATVFGGQLPRPRLGIGFTCSECGTRTDPATGDELWFFSQPLEVTAVDEGGPADQAGIQIGDLIKAVNGHSLQSEEGGRAFTDLKSGESVRLTLAKRNGREVEVTVIPAEAGPAAVTAPAAPAVPEVPPARPARGGISPAPFLPPLPPDSAVAASPPEGLPVRYLGTVAGVEVEVRGAPVMVSELRGARVILIQANGLWIRVRVPPGAETARERQR